MKNPFKFALIMAFVIVGTVYADVKVRVYLKDGSLQAGNLITETEKTIVILGKNGRDEINKDKIMFVNGKPLAFWRDHPERNYQTEIIPSEIPQPGYVNDKAALPPPPPLPKLETILPKPVAVVEQKAEPVEPRATPTPTPIPKSEPVVKKEVGPVVPVVVKPVENVVEKIVEKKEAVPVVVAEPAKVVRPRRAKPQEPVAIVEKVRPRRNTRGFSREVMAQQHLDLARQFLGTGERGHALQELHFSSVLNRQDPEAALLLGRLYAEDGVASRAEKILTNPGLRKNTDAQQLLADMKAGIEHEEKQRKVWMGSAVGGILLALLSPLLVRRLRRSKPVPAVTLSADQIELPEVEKAPVEEVVTAKPVPVAPPKPVVIPEKKPMWQEKPKQPEPVAPPPVPLIPEIPAPAMIEPPMVSSSSILKTGDREIPKKSIDDLILAREEFLSTSKTVDEIVAKGHGFAGAGNIEAARKEYRTALALHPQCGEAILGLAYLAFAQQNWEIALEYYLQVAQINPKSADAHYGIGRVFLETHHEGEAVEEFRKTLSLDPTYYEARETLTALGVAV